MIKRTLIIIISLLVLKSGFAQADSLAVKKFNRFSVAFTGGMGIPVGKFIIYNSNNYAGPPNVGFLGKVETTYLILKNLGLECIYYGSVNKAEALDQSTLFPNYWNGAMGGGGGQTLTSYNTKTWYTNNILFGIAPQIDLDIIKIRLKLSGGWQQAKSPEARVDGTWQGWSAHPPSFASGNFTINQPVMISYNFVFGAGFDIRFPIKKKLGFIIGLDYLNSYAHFKGNLIDQNGNSVSNSFDKLIMIYSFNMGLCYEFK